jgi:uncharacterized protein
VARVACPTVRPVTERVSETELRATRCGSCGLVAAPPEPIGCERCGAPAASLVATDIEAVGTVTAVAVVHHHARPEPPTPFVVVEVALDAGPVVRSMLRGAAAPGPELGQRVTGSFDAEGRYGFDRATVA